jgi:hypothetical protein
MNLVSGNPAIVPYDSLRTMSTSVPFDPNLFPDTARAAR